MTVTPLAELIVGLELIQHAAERRMLAVLDLDPVRRPARAIRPVLELRHQSLQPHHASMPEQVRADLALFEVGQEDASLTRISKRII
jgi:hypothetical protein